MADALQLEGATTDRYQLEDATGVYLLEQSVGDWGRLAPPADIPHISPGHALSGSASPTIAPTTGWWREKRDGFAEPDVGTTPATTVNTVLDLTGSTRFAYPALPQGDPLASFPSGYVISTLKPGGTAQQAFWPFNVDLVTDSPVIELRLQAPVAAPSLGRIFVNGKPISETATFLSGRTAGSGYGVVLTFDTAATRRITIYGLNNTVGRFGGVAVLTGHTVTKPTAPVTKRLAVIGDSFVNGAGSSISATSGANIVETFALRVAVELGMDEVILAGIGGTGYTGGAAGEKFIDRVSAVMALNPTHVLVAGGRNDTATGEQAAVEAVLDAIGAGVTRWVTHTASNASQAAVIAAIAAGAASRGVTFVDLDIDSVPKIVGDGVHPTFAGHVQISDALAPQLAAVTPAGISSSEAFGTPTVTLDSTGVTVTPNGIITGEAFGSPTLSATLTASPTGIGTGEALGSPTITTTLTASPAGIGTGEVVGVPVVTTTLTLTPTGIPTGEAFGVPTATTAGIVTPTGIGSGQAFGTPAITTTLTVTPAGVTSGAALGAPTITTTLTATPAGIATGAAVGAPAVTTTLTATPGGIATGVVIGTPTVTVSIPGITVTPTGITTGEAFGAVWVTPSYTPLPEVLTLAGSRTPLSLTPDASGLRIVATTSARTLTPEAP